MLGTSPLAGAHSAHLPGHHRLLRNESRHAGPVFPPWFGGGGKGGFGQILLSSEKMLGQWQNDILFVLVKTFETCFFIGS